MDFLEKVDRLRQRANVTYEEAKQALEQTGGDLLEAVILLEKQGKVDPPPPTRPAPSAGEGGQQHTYQQGQSGRATFGEVCGRFVRFLGRLVRRRQRQFSGGAPQRGGDDLPAGDGVCAAADLRLLGGGAADDRQPVLRLEVQPARA